MALNQKFLSKQRKPCQSGIIVQALVILLLCLAAVMWTLQSSALISGYKSLAGHARGVLREASSFRAVISNTSVILLEDSPLVSHHKDASRKKSTRKKIIREADWTEDVNVRNCTREKDPLRRKRRRTAPIRSVQEMTQMLLRNQRSSCMKAPEWSSPMDQEVLQARREILSAPIVEDDPELYSPAYRNFSTFKKSYELMEKMLKVHVYKEGQKPIFHQPLLSGIYAAEGWFMKHMEESVHFLVDDPSKAHLFYMPYSSAELRFRLFDNKVRDKDILVSQLQNFVSSISQKYPFWNRTGGADHFSVACHDWASIFKQKAMGDSIMAICNADINGEFELGKDVSITLTPVRNSRNPVSNMGGLPRRERDNLAFFAGQMHGKVRPLVFQHWGDNRDSDVKVFGKIPPGGRTYAEHMKSSKFCLCPSGYEVNSPRLAETFFYECVPVIISDNFVPPFFDVLNWEAFSIVVPVNDIPKLKEILLSVPGEKYLALHHGVKMVQRHFLWHLKPERYDLFHMTLHSVWFNRVLQFREISNESSISSIAETGLLNGGVQVLFKSV